MKERQVKLNINFRILPFGHASVEIKDRKGKRKKETPLYAEPKTSNLEWMEITFDGIDYIVPKTTGGFL